jgi:hypothetical protein
MIAREAQAGTGIPSRNVNRTIRLDEADPIQQDIDRKIANTNKHHWQ